MATSNYGKKSLERLALAHQELAGLFLRVGERFPNTILETSRTLEQQKRNVEKGVSKTMDSRHLDVPPNAVDAAPDPLEWPSLGKVKARIKELLGEQRAHHDSAADELEAAIEEYAKDLARWYYFGGYVLGVAEEMGLDIRWGGDWNGNRKVDDQSFDDLPHFERRGLSTAERLRNRELAEKQQRIIPG